MLRVITKLFVTPETEKAIAINPHQMLRDAIKYLEQYGTGNNLEYSRARTILQYALMSIEN